MEMGSDINDGNAQMSKRKQATDENGDGQLIIAPARSDKQSLQRLQKAISKAIKQSGLSDVELNNKAGISIAMARRLVAGKVSDMKLSTLTRLIQFGGVDPSAIFDSIKS